MGERVSSELWPTGLFVPQSSSELGIFFIVTVSKISSRMCLSICFKLNSRTENDKGRAVVNSKFCVGGARNLPKGLVEQPGQSVLTLWTTERY